MLDSHDIVGDLRAGLADRIYVRSRIGLRCSFCNRISRFYRSVNTESCAKLNESYRLQGSSDGHFNFILNRRHKACFW